MKSHVLGLLSALVCLGGPASAQSLGTWPGTTSSLPDEMISFTVFVQDWPAITSFQLTLTSTPGAHIESVEIPPAGVTTSLAATSSETSLTANLTAPATPSPEGLVLATVVFSVPAPAPYSFTGVYAVLQTTGPAGTSGSYGNGCTWSQPDAYTVPAPALEKRGAQLDAHRIDFSAGATTQGIKTLLANTGSVWTEGMTVSALLTSPDGLQYLRLPNVGWPPLLLAPGSSGELQLTFEHTGVLHVAGGWTAQVRAWGAQSYGGTMIGSDGSKTLHYRVVL